MLRLSAFMQPHDCFARGATAKQLATAERRLGGPLPWQARPLSLSPPSLTWCSPSLDLVEAACSCRRKPGISMPEQAWLQT